MHKNNNQLTLKKQQETKGQFITDLIDKLDDINTVRIKDNKEPLDVCFMTSIVDTKIMKYTDFVNDLQYKYFIEDYVEDEMGYSDGQINIQIHKNNATVVYTILFQSYYIDELDAYVPSFELSKTEYMGGETWDIYEDEEYEDYKKRFIKNHQEIIDKQSQQEKLLKKQSIEQQIALLQGQLKTLDL